MNRKAPPPDRFASFPYNGKILAYFAGVFEAVFVDMQPFCKIEKEHQWILNRNIDVSKQEFIRYAKAISWQEIMQIEHSRHRSVNNFMVNIMAAVVAYCLNPNKPTFQNMLKG